MLSKQSWLVVSVIGIILVWGTLKTITYFTYQNPPEVVLVGIEQDGFCSKKVSCAIQSDNRYKIDTINLILDEKPLAISKSNKVRSRKVNLPFVLDTTTFADGPHTLTITAIDASHHANKTIVNYNFSIDNTPLCSAFTLPEYRVDQGKTLHLKVSSNKSLKKCTFKVFSQTFDGTPAADNSTTYECFIPIECEMPPVEHMIVAELQDHVHNTVTLTSKVSIIAFEFKKQRGFAVDETKLEEEKQAGKDNKELDLAVEKLAQESPKRKLWHGPFEYPIEVQRMTTPFGEIRTTPERGRYMHKGVDLINRPKCVVWASQHGKVVLMDRFFIHGNTVVVDHGLGIMTLYAHLEEFADIHVGDMIKKGNPVGKLGKTGYATGYHLHWELRINNIAIDPLEWTSSIY